MPIPWLFLLVSVVGFWFTYNAYRPLFRPASLSVLSFFAGWLTGELPLHHLAWQLLVTAAFVWKGALAGWPGWVGLGLTALSWAGLAQLLRRSLDAREAIDAALLAALGEDYGEWAAHHLPPELAPSTNLRQLLFPIPIRHRGVERIAGVTYHQEGRLRLRLDVYRSRRRGEQCPCLLYVHGGAWVLGRKEQQGLPMMQHLAARGWVCFGIDYRLSPRATFPDHLVDVKRALAWVREHGAEYGADPGFVIIAGGSAGGHLSALAALTAGDPLYQPGFEDADTSVSGCVPLYGIYDFEDRDGLWPHQGMKNLLERHVMKATRLAAPDAFALASPRRRIHEGAPPFLVIHGDLDTLVPVEEARRFVAALRKGSPAPVVYAEIPGAQHAFEVMPSLRTSLVLAGIARFGGWLHAGYLKAQGDRRRLDPVLLVEPRPLGRGPEPRPSGRGTRA